VTHRRKNVIIIIVAVVLAVLILNAVITGGIIFICHSGFELSAPGVFRGLFSHRSVGGIRVGEGIGPTYGIPFVFLVHCEESPPYRIELIIDDRSESLAKIVITSVSIEYGDGQKIEHRVDWERPLESTIARTSRDGELVQIRPMCLNENLPVTVDRKANCNIRLVGYFTDKEGEDIPFDTTGHFEYKPCEWRVYTVRWK
jgi:hypothetical protein